MAFKDANNNPSICPYYCCLLLFMTIHGFILEKYELSPTLASRISKPLYCWSILYSRARDKLLHDFISAKYFPLVLHLEFSHKYRPPKLMLWLNRMVTRARIRIALQILWRIPRTSPTQTRFQGSKMTNSFVGNSGHVNIWALYLVLPQMLMIEMS